MVTSSPLLKIIFTAVCVNFVSAGADQREVKKQSLRGQDRGETQFGLLAIEPGRYSRFGASVVQLSPAPWAPAAPIPAPFPGIMFSPAPAPPTPLPAPLPALMPVPAPA